MGGNWPLDYVVHPLKSINGLKVRDTAYLLTVCIIIRTLSHLYLLSFFFLAFGSSLSLSASSASSPCSPWACMPPEKPGFYINKHLASSA